MTAEEARLHRARVYLSDIERAAAALARDRAWELIDPAPLSRLWLETLSGCAEEARETVGRALFQRLYAPREAA